VSFDVSADAYLRFMGQYSEPLAARFADLAGVRPGQRLLDVGCGPGALTAELVRRAGADAISAVEPSTSFADAVRERLPGVDVRRSAAEQLPFPDHTFDVTAAQLVVHFMTDPVQGLREMGRVTRPGGVVAACVWDHAGGRGPLAAFWSAVAAYAGSGGAAGSPPEPNRSSGVYLDLDARDVLAYWCEDFAAQPVVLGVLVVDAVRIGVLPVIGDREAPPAVAQSEVRSDGVRDHPREPERGDCRQALLEKRDIGLLLGKILGRPQAADHHVAYHQRAPGRTAASRPRWITIATPGVCHSLVRSVPWC
jgi:SAM-dependent methyltransferase